MPIHQPVGLKLRALGIENITHLTLVKAHPLLLRLIKDVKLAAERVVQVLHIARGVQGVPGADTGLALARLEHKEQRVEAGNDLVKGDAEEGGRGVGVGVEEVVDLIGVRLDKG
jgi:hypothetical protein